MVLQEKKKKKEKKGATETEDEEAKAKRERESRAEELRKANETQSAELFGPRITEADKANDRKSLYRKLDKKLFLIVKRKRDQHTWQFPQGDWVKGEMIREVCTRHVGDKFSSFLIFSHISCHYWCAMCFINRCYDSLVNASSSKSSPLIWTSISLETVLKASTATSSLVMFRRK